MANVYSLALLGYSTTTLAAPSVFWELRSSVLGSCRITKIAMSMEDANSTASWGLGRSTSLGVNPLNLQSLAAYDMQSGPSQSRIATQWQVAPGAPTNFLRRLIMRNTTSPGYFITSPKGIVVGSNSSMVLAVTSLEAGGADNVNIDCEVIE